MNKDVFVVFVRGLPGAGKSTVSIELSKRERTVLVDPDFVADKNIRSSRQERLRKYYICLGKCRKALSKGLSVIWSQPWRKLGNIQLTMERLKESHTNFLLINIEIPIEESWKRSKEKFSGSRKEFNEYIAKFIPLNKTLSIKSITLNGTENSVKNIKIVEKFLRYNVQDE
jgi:predicted kinase